AGTGSAKTKRSLEMSSLMKPENVRLTPYETTQVPEGFEIITERKGRRAPVVSPWNWYARYTHPGHFIFHHLANTPGGVTADDLKAMIPDEAMKAEVDKTINLLKAGTARFAG